MSTNNVHVPYLRTSRSFPTDLQPLVVQINKMYNDIATSVNCRTVGIFADNTSVATGETWYVLDSIRELVDPNGVQTLRKTFQFTGTGSIPHGIDFNNILGFTRIYGTVTDGTLWTPLPYADITNVINQVLVLVNPTNIVIASNTYPVAGGFVVLEYLGKK